MGTYKQKPVVVEAIRWDGTNHDEVVRFLKDLLSCEIAWDGNDPCATKMAFRTLGGNHVVRVGDYIIRGVVGELYTCRPDVFEQTYDQMTPKASWTERLAALDAEYKEDAGGDDDSLISALEKIMGRCRFCGEGRPFIDEAHTCDGTPLYYGMCPECGACGPVGHGPAEACNLWNYGTSAPAAKED